MQPLSYQSAEHTCWVTCMVNGIRLVTQTDRIPTSAYLQLHSLLDDDGVSYYTTEELKLFEKVICKVNTVY